MTYAFSFDASACSGCKACQAACKDKNNLPTGVLWRRVMEVSGGSWQKNGEAWNNSVFAYNLSISCNHCIHPKCAGVCPTNAYEVRADGIVLLHTEKCVGCGYCAWACPYGAPQYNPSSGTMTKCDFCLDRLEEGLAPTCVAACPLRALDCTEAPVPNGLALWELPPEAHPFPLPAFSRTQPRLVIRPHPAMSCVETKSLANWEEIQPRRPSGWSEFPLLLFTLLTQLAVGGLWLMGWLFQPLWLLVEHDATTLKLLPSLTIGSSLGLGMLASFAHLGTKKNAWRVFSNWRKSSLSREILFTVLFGLGWLVTTLQTLFWHGNIFEWTTITTILGIGLIYNMARVYRLRAAPGWNTWQTPVSFLVSTLLLGACTMAALLSYESAITGVQVATLLSGPIYSGILVLLVVQQALINRKAYESRIAIIRSTGIVAGMLICLLALIVPAPPAVSMYVLALLVASEEVLGRWMFYQSRLSP